MDSPGASSSTLMIVTGWRLLNSSIGWSGILKAIHNCIELDDDRRTGTNDT
ncbi:hypothetical protein RSAG8_08764, partial [Rhizoctonia solani AG-8 WAC10335]